jgi:hypothetical protein
MGLDRREPRRRGADSLARVTGMRMRSRAVIKIPRLAQASSTNGQNFDGIPRFAQ